MCFSANISLGFGLAGLAAAAVTYQDKTESIWVRIARAYPLFHFSLMEFIQYFAYPVLDQCGFGTNLFLSEVSTYHISLQALAIMPAIASYSSDPNAVKKATLLGCFLSGTFLTCNFLPADLQLPYDWLPPYFGPNFIGQQIACIRTGIYHLAYAIPSSYGMVIIYGSLFALMWSGFVWKNNWRMASYHCLMGFLFLYAPQWLFGVQTGEASAMYCFYSIPIAISFLPRFKYIFSANKDSWDADDGDMQLQKIRID
jgi:hypothetical protein